MLHQIHQPHDKNYCSYTMHPGDIYKKMGQSDHGEEGTEPCSANRKGRTVPCLLFTLADLAPLRLIHLPFFYNTTISSQPYQSLL